MVTNQAAGMQANYPAASGKMIISDPIKNSIQHLGGVHKIQGQLKLFPAFVHELYQGGGAFRIATEMMIIEKLQLVQVRSTLAEPVYSFPDISHSFQNTNTDDQLLIFCRHQ